LNNNFSKPRILIESIKGTEYINYEYDLDDKMLKILIDTKVDKWVEILKQEDYFMRNKKNKKNLMQISFKKIKNLTHMMNNKKKYLVERGLSSKYRKKDIE
jgi:hypothetical protein